MSVSTEELKQIMPHAGARAETYGEHINAAMIEFGIDTLLREAMFIAQIAHESGELRYVRELASGDAYEGRRDLGNTQPGDGRRYKGRGLMQITGRHNYRECGEALGVDLLADPQLLERADLAAQSAGWFWSSRNLNPLADAGDIEAITRKINGGLKRLAARKAYYERAKVVLGT